MDILEPENHRLAASVGEAVQANNASGMRRAVYRFHGWFFHKPEYVPDGSVVGIDEARSRHEAEVVAEGTAGLATTPVSINAEGELFDMAKHRELKEKRAEVAASFETAPLPDASQTENLSQI